MASYEPALAHLLHIRPWEMALMTVAQVERAMAFVDDYTRQMKQATATGV